MHGGVGGTASGGSSSSNSPTSTHIAKRARVINTGNDLLADVREQFSYVKGANMFAPPSTPGSPIAASPRMRSAGYGGGGVGYAGQHGATRMPLNMQVPSQFNFGSGNIQHQQQAFASGGGMNSMQGGVTSAAASTHGGSMVDNNKLVANSKAMYPPGASTPGRTNSGSAYPYPSHTQHQAFNHTPANPTSSAYTGPQQQPGMGGMHPSNTQSHNNTHLVNRDSLAMAGGAPGYSNSPGLQHDMQQAHHMGGGVGAGGGSGMDKRTRHMRNNMNPLSHYQQYGPGAQFGAGQSAGYHQGAVGGIDMSASPHANRMKLTAMRQMSSSNSSQYDNQSSSSSSHAGGFPPAASAGQYGPSQAFASSRANNNPAMGGYHGNHVPPGMMPGDGQQHQQAMGGGVVHGPNMSMLMSNDLRLPPGAQPGPPMGSNPRAMLPNSSQLPGNASSSVGGNNPMGATTPLAPGRVRPPPEGLMEQIITDRSCIFRTHPLFPLLRDLTIADMNFNTPSFPVQLIENLPANFDKLLQNYLNRNPPSQSPPNESIDTVLMDALRYAHQSLIGKSTQVQQLPWSRTLALTCVDINPTINLLLILPRIMIVYERSSSTMQYKCKLCNSSRSMHSDTVAYR